MKQPQKPVVSRKSQDFKQILEVLGVDVRASLTAPIGIESRMISMRLDDDLVEWLKSFGPGYQAKIKMLLRASMQSAQSRIEPAGKSDSAGIVYGVSDGSRIKIGHTRRSMSERLSGLPGVFLVAYANVGNSALSESLAHDFFKACHIEQEWFAITPTDWKRYLLTYVKECIEKV